MKPEEKYPLSDTEHNLVLNELLGSGAVFVLLGIVLSITYTGLRTGDWLAVFAHFAWAVDFSQAMTLGNAPLTGVLLALGLPAVFVLLSEVVVHKLLWARSEKYREDVYETRRGFSGELARMGVRDIAVTAVVAGFAEEFCFRYGAIGALTVLFNGIFDFRFSMALAIVVTSLAFASAHAQYGRWWEKLTIAVYALSFGSAYVVTGSLLVVVLAHALYDFGVELLEGRRMLADDDYFGGEQAPDGLLGKQTKELREMLRNRNKRD